MADQVKEQVLPSGTFMFLADGTKGSVWVQVGPTVVNPNATDFPVKWNAITRRYEKCDIVEAVQRCVQARSNQYVVLNNPAISRDAAGVEKNLHPDTGKTVDTRLENGAQIILKGALQIALWPGQDARVIDGHSIGLDQYLIVQIIDEAAAKKYWNDTVIKFRNGKTKVKNDTLSAQAKREMAEEVLRSSGLAILDGNIPEDLSLGQRFIVPGTHVSYFMPCTGMMVEESEAGFVENAVSLSTLEFAVLTNDDGTQRYERGPMVVFPLPTETFVTTKDKSGQASPKFQATQLNASSGIFVTVIEDYTDGDRSYKKGDDLFITGGLSTGENVIGDVKIYYPRREHAINNYEGKQVHYGAMVSKGEGRYVLDRKTSGIRLVKGPKMLLPNPIDEIFVRRVLTATQATTWYPGNTSVADYNNELRAIATRAPSTRAGTVSEGDYSRNTSNRELESFGASGPASLDAERGSITRGMNNIASRSMNPGAAPGTSGMTKSGTQASKSAFTADSFEQGATYSDPRSVTMRTSMQGPPKISPWMGYAVEVCSSNGGRQVIVGPADYLLEFDEVLTTLELSTGKPKNTDRLQRVAYLQTLNNNVSDVIDVMTGDHVPFQLKVVYLVNFEESGSTPEERVASRSKWFATQNYVKRLCDHTRSLLKGAMTQYTAQNVYSAYLEIIKDTLLGEADKKTGIRPGLSFSDNNMRLADIDVLNVVCTDSAIGQKLAMAQQQSIDAEIEREFLARLTEITKLREAAKQDESRAKAETLALHDELVKKSVETSHLLAVDKLLGQTEVEKLNKVLVDAREDVEMLKMEARLERDQALLDHNLEADQRKAALALETVTKKLACYKDALVAETESMVTRYGAVDGDLAAALRASTEQHNAVALMQAGNLSHALGAGNAVELFHKIVETPVFAGLAEKLKPATTTASAIAGTDVSK